MKKRYHIQITVEALNVHFGSRALKSILDANTKQDSLSGQIRHPEYHFDNSQFAEAYAYMAEQELLVYKQLQNNALTSAWQAFGRMIHAAQDFYAHSNYVCMWLSSQNGTSDISPETIDPITESILNDPKLISGSIYYPWEVLSFIPGMANTMRRFLPKDSHTALNLDGPEQGPFFDYAYVAARKRTRLEFEKLSRNLLSDDLQLFTEKTSLANH